MISFKGVASAVVLAGLVSNNFLFLLKFTTSLPQFGLQLLNFFRVEMHRLRLRLEVRLFLLHLFHPEFRIFHFKEADTARIISMIYGELNAYSKQKQNNASGRQPSCEKRHHTVFPPNAPRQGSEAYPERGCSQISLSESETTNER